MKLFRRILSIVIFILLVGWAIMLFMDYSKVRVGEKPQFCFFKEETHQYDDGTTYECLGLGYRAFIYERDSISASEFGPFFIKEKTQK